MTTLAPQSGHLQSITRLESPSMAHTILSDIGVVVERAEGSGLRDTNGRDYLDLTAGSGVLALGHGHPAVRAAMHRQVDAFAHGGWQLGCPPRIELAERLAELLPWEDPAVLWCTTGSEAVEAALKTARVATGRRQVLGFLGGYHGKTAGALAVTASARFRAGVSEVPVAGLSLPYPAAASYRRGDEPATTGHDFGQGIITHPDFGSCDVAAIVVETVQGAGGMNAAAPGFLAELREVTRRLGILLVVDEIFTGFGRTGSLFGFEQHGLIPDLVVLGKALGGGLPVSLVAGPRELLDRVPALSQTSTFSANPVALAAGLAVLDTILGDDLSARARTVGAGIADAVAALRVHGVQLRVLGQGLMLGVEVVTAPAPDRSSFARAVVARMREAGVIALRGGADGAVVKWTPPLTISEADAATSVRVLAEALAAEAGCPA